MASLEVKGMLERERGRNKCAEADQTAVIQEADARPATSTFAELRPWLERIRWEETYSTVNREVLRALAVIPPSPRSLLLGRGGTRIGCSRLEDDLVSPADDKKKIAALVAVVDRVMD